MPQQGWRQDKEKRSVDGLREVRKGSSEWELKSGDRSLINHLKTMAMKGYRNSIRVRGRLCSYQ